MSEFNLFEKILEQYENSKLKSDEDFNDDDNCSHLNMTNEKGVFLCIDCGQEIEYEFNNDKEWRYYGQSDNKYTTDPNRVQIRKIEDRNIFKDVENLGFSESIILKANKIYNQVTQGKIFRGNSRKAIVFACIFHSYKMLGKPQSHEKLIKIFSLNKKIGLKGLKYVNLNAPKESKIRTTYITPINLIEEIMDKFTTSFEQKKEVLDIYEKVKNKSSKLNRSRPMSVASGIVYYWILSKNKDITIKDFAKKVSLSELTINKISKEISDILGETY